LRDELVFERSDTKGRLAARRHRPVSLDGMVLERAIMTIQPGAEAEFERALPAAREVIGRSPGFRSLTVLRGIEEPSSYMLLIEWDRLEDHTESFRNSELFGRWRELIGPFFAAPPDVQHYDELSELEQHTQTATS
jgi:heme-degrading monooxygenase HmoA